MKRVQGQQSFIKGEIRPSALARLGNDYFSSCLSIKNMIVRKDGSVVCRNPFKNGQTIEKLVNISDVEALKHGENLIFFVRGDEGGQTTEKCYLCLQNSEKIVTLKFNIGKIYKYSTQGSEESLDFVLDESIKTSFEDFSTDKIRKIKKVRDRIYVFFEGCFPFKIWIEGDNILTAPFFFGAQDEIYNVFPFSRTLGDELNVQKVVTNSRLGPKGTDNKLYLRIKNVEWDEEK